MWRRIIRYILSAILAVLFVFIGILLREYIEASKEPEVLEEIPLCHADSLRLKVISIGDVQSYLELRDSFEFSKFPHEILFYSIVMAMQYGYIPAYCDASKSLKTFYNYPNMRPMDSFTDSVYKAFLQKNDHGDSSTDHFSAKVLVN